VKCIVIASASEIARFSRKDAYI